MTVHYWRSASAMIDCLYCRNVKPHAHSTAVICKVWMLCTVFVVLPVCRLGHLPRQVGRVLMGIEPWLLFTLTEQTRWTNRGGISGWAPGGSSKESPSRMLKESSSWFTVFVSERDSSSVPSSAPPSALLLPCSWYSTSRSVSLSDTMQQPDTFSGNGKEHKKSQAGYSYQPTVKKKQTGTN